MAEVWKSIPGWEQQYEVSTLGRVRSIRDSHGERRREPLIRKTQLLHTGSTPSLALGRIHGTNVGYTVASLMLAAFVEPPPYADSIACFHDGDRRNIRMDNLFWGRNRGATANRFTSGLRVGGFDFRGARHGK